MYRVDHSVRLFLHAVMLQNKIEREREMQNMYAPSYKYKSQIRLLYQDKK